MHRNKMNKAIQLLCLTSNYIGGHIVRTCSLCNKNRIEHFVITVKG